ncbi:MAG TPA: sodium-dependent transporter [Atribacterota bacterium]|nr:sodium-dependent transporter [Atribacterota bacterium]HOR42357.1 sodium-dependent transporter [Atribacterota bacterium]
MNGNEREQWQSRLGFIAAAAGSAIGLGNIWRFPYITGKYGGGAFVLLYILIVIFVGYPVMNSELLLGRKTQRAAVGTFKALAPGTPWVIVGYMGVLAGFMILSYYSVVAGWALAYIFKSGAYMAAGAEPANIFVGLITSPSGGLFWHTLFMLMCIGIVAGGIQKGIERWSLILMPALFILLIILIIRSVTLPGAEAGLAFYLKPNLKNFSGEGFLAALGQVFFSLSLGMGCMVTYGSYLKKSEDIPLDAKYIVISDTSVALLAGFVIFPAVFAFGLEPAAGPSLTFITIPAVLAKMGASGHIFGIIFFTLLMIAALTSAISLLEVAAAYFIDELKFDRKKATVIMGILIWLLGFFPTLGYSTLSHVKLIKGMDLLDSFDFVANNMLLPLGGMLTTIFIGWYWGTDKALEEVNHNASTKLGGNYAFLIKYVVPIAIFIVFLNSTGIIG